MHELYEFIHDFMNSEIHEFLISEFMHELFNIQVFNPFYIIIIIYKLKKKKKIFLKNQKIQ